VNSDIELEKHFRAFNSLYAIYGDVEQALLSIPEAHRKEVTRRWEESRPTSAMPAVMSAEEVPDWWTAVDRASLRGWTRFMDLLLRNGWHETAVRNLDVESDAVMREIALPSAPSFRVQGLVVGYVQSGKTANFTSVIAKAVDSGYRLVIVLAGIHNSLRRQTQQRLEKELCAPSPDGAPGWLTLTRPDLAGDFRVGTIGSGVLHGNQPMLAVVKKNGAVLKRLLDWLPDAAALNSLPVLIIDDEADQASVNTAGNQAEETDPEEDYSRINGLIRQLLSRFTKVSYVAYTATPFANVFIDHEGFDYRVQGELYPRDFIIALDKPSTYIGASDLFGFPEREGEPGREPLKVIVTVPDADISYVVPPSRSKKSPETTAPDEKEEVFPSCLPNSLEAAIEDFLLASGAFLHRKQDRGDQPLGMLIHTTVQKDAQVQLGKLVDQHLSKIRRQFLYDRKAYLPHLRSRWESHFRPVTESLQPSRDVAFEVIVPFIDRLFASGPGKSPLRVLTVNSASDDVLDYEAEPNLKAIVVGGNKLSRGLTIEGLLSSYFVRESPLFDTLLQMGRWFGHRRDYVDLTRIHTTAELVDWFQFLARAEDELREDIRLYGIHGLKPTAFAPRVRCHEILRPTSANKMKNASPVGTSYAGRLKQTILFPFDRPRELRANLDGAQVLVDEMGPPEAGQSAPTWSDIKPSMIVRFLRAFRTPSEGLRAGAVDPSRLADYIEAQQKFGELVSWDVRVVTLQGDHPFQHPFEIAGLPLIARSRRAGTQSIGTLVNPATRGTRDGDELLGLTEEQILRAEQEVERVPKLGWGTALRYQRDPRKGALLIYPIDPKSKPNNSRSSDRSDLQEPSRFRREPLFPNGVPDEVPGALIGFAIVFPNSRSAATDNEHWVGSPGAFVQR
jgi:hypothetical protein